MVPPVLRALLPAAAVGVALVGCNSTLSLGSLRQSITDKLAEVDVKVTSVDCPNDRPAKKDDTFNCTVTMEGGQSITVQVRQTDDAGSLSFDVGKQVFATRNVVPELERGLKGSGFAAVVVTCPKGIVIPGGAGTLTCTATADGQGFVITVPIKDGTAQLNDEKLEPTAGAQGSTSTTGSSAPPESVPPESVPPSTSTP